MIKAVYGLLLVGGLVASATIAIEGVDKKTKEIHERAITVDTHVDTPMALLDEDFDIGKRNSAPQSRVDFPRMEEGGLDAIFFAAFTSQKERTPENIEKAYSMAHQMIDRTYEVCKEYSSKASIATAANDVVKLEKKGKRAIYIGLENGFPIGTDLARVEEFYQRGTRYITLCHTKNNDICDSSTDRNGPEHDGLSPFGKEVVQEMNRLGILIDVSHISDKSYFDVLEESKAPIIASHSSVRSIANHPRNFSDEMLLALKENGGVIQICLLDSYIQDPDTTTMHYKKRQELRAKYERWDKMSETEQKALRAEWRSLSEKYPKKLPTVQDCVDHIDYVKNLIGVDYVGIGSDFDGGGGLDGVADVSEFPNITAEMLKRGYTEEEINKVWGGNFFRVFKEVELLTKSL